MLDPEIERRFGWTRGGVPTAPADRAAFDLRLRRSYEEGRGDPAPVLVTAARIPAPGLDGPGELAVRLHRSPGPAPTPTAALVWAHGGGFGAGDLDMLEADEVARELVVRAGLAVLTVDYALTRGKPVHPIPHLQLIAAARWLRAGAGAGGFGIDRARIALGGASAGAAIAWSAAVELRDAAPDEAPWRLVLAYPALYRRPVRDGPEPAGLRALPAVLRIPDGAIADMFAAYAGSGPSSASASADDADLRGLPRTLVLAAEWDDLRAGAERFARALRIAGVEVRRVVVPGTVHGFLNLPGRLPATAQGLDEIAGFLTGPG